jgi:Tfp pilus assembly protein PilZ
MEWVERANDRTRCFLPEERDHRRHLRRTVEVEIKVGDSTLGGEMFFDSRNVSGGGVFLKSDLLLEVGECIWISFFLPSLPTVIHTRGKVVWVNRDPDENDPSDLPGMGVQFMDLGPDQMLALNAYLEQT